MFKSKIRFKEIILFLVVLMFTGILVNDSSAQDYTSKSKKAIKYYEKATFFYEQKNYTQAIENARKATQTDSVFVESYLLMADIYHDLKQADNEIEMLKMSLLVNPSFYPDAFYLLAQLFIAKGDFQNAKNQLLSLNKYENATSEFKEKSIKQIQQCDFAISAIKKPVNFEPVSVGDDINTVNDEYFPSLTIDENTLIYTTRLPSSINGRPTWQEDFFESKRVDNSWTKGIPLNGLLNTKDNEGAQTITINGKIIYFTHCTCPDGMIRCCDIYVSYSYNNQWSRPVNLGKPLNSDNWDSQPSVSADGNTLYFVSNRPGGKGKKDIWMSKKNKNNQWSQPVNLGDSVNTSDDEITPFIHPDNQTLYFASNGHAGMGGLDLFMCKRKKDQQWGSPVNLGYPINTTGDESGLIINSRGNFAFFATDRIGNNGLDIYSFMLPEGLRPNPVSYIKGNVYDIETKKMLVADFELTCIDSVIDNYTTRSDENGTFMLCLPVQKKYAFHVFKEGYLMYSSNFYLQITDSIKPYLLDIPLTRIRTGEKFVLNNIFFETDSYTLKDISFTELNLLLIFLNTNPKVKIEISGHTDNVGSEKYNLELSNNRAKSVMDYLIKNGIDNKRLIFKGYGYSQPIAENTSSEGRAKNRRTEIKIIADN